MKLAPPTRRLARRLALPVAALGLLAPRAPAQTFTWNNTGTDWQSAGSWNPNTVPTSGLALFRQAGSATGTATTGPSISGSVAALSLTTGPSQNFGGWNFTGAGTITLGGTGSQGLFTGGRQTTSFNGPLLAGFGSGGLSVTVQSGSTLVLSGATTAVTNLSTSLAVYGGTLRLDNAATDVANRLAIGSTVTVSGGGALELLGNAAGGTYTVGPIDLSNAVGGVNAIRVTPLGSSAPTILQFANVNTGITGGFSSRPGLRGVYSYEATTGDLGAAKGAQVRFTGTPYLGPNGLLSTANAGGSVGFAIVKDAGGTDFATYLTPTGVTRAGATATATDATGLAGLTAASRGQFNPAAGGTTTAAGPVTTGSLRVTPAGAGATLALGTSALATNALMLDGPNNFAISGTGTLGVTGTRYVYVNSSAATLSTSLVVASASNPTVFAGPGFVDLTGGGSQNTLSSTGRFVIAGGTVRANAAQVGFTASGPGVVSLSGGVLEIKGGTNGTGTSADFTRPVGASAGGVTWNAQAGNELGGGGFSASGTAASVNLGGATTPTPFQWNANDFVGSGFALKFGSTKSDAVLTWHNPILLDGAVQTVREFNVTAGAGGDRAVLAGVVSGASTADFLKTGGGNLVLGAANSYAGSTLVHGGTLTLGATNAVPTASPIFLGNATLSSGVAGGFSANLGALSLTTGTPTVALGTGGHTLSFTTLSVNVPGLAVTGFTGTAGASGTGGRLVFTGLGSSTASANGAFASFLANTSFSGYALGATFISSGASLELVPAPVPEPATVFGLAALGLAATGLARRLRAKTPRS